MTDAITTITAQMYADVSKGLKEIESEFDGIRERKDFEAMKSNLDTIEQIVNLSNEIKNFLLVQVRKCAEAVNNEAAKECA